MQAPFEIDSAINQAPTITKRKYLTFITSLNAARDVYKLTNFCIDFDLISNGTDIVKANIAQKTASPAVRLQLIQLKLDYRFYGTRDGNCRLDKVH